MQIKAIVLILISILLNSMQTIAQSKSKLWYEQPAACFEESLVLGNGKMGASVFGGVNSDKIYLNDATLWSGEPEDPNMNPEAYKSIPLVREALKNHDYKLADILNKKTRGVFSESFAPLGTLTFKFKHQGNYQEYYRDLDITNAISKISYKADGIKFMREYFVSHPDQIMAIRLSSSKKQAINGSIGFESLLKYHTATSDQTIVVNGYAPYHAEPNYMGDIPDAVLFDKERGNPFYLIDPN